uniref:ALOG domain-containing protein n=1 Tax=Ananas comosus var. bracteatus TaxID=296719 RepID=A0A6V7NQT3_ANACO|nr:unnamed protein product [Ananas comosus var. bracteatus]
MNVFPNPPDSPPSDPFISAAAAAAAASSSSSAAAAAAAASSSSSLSSQSQSPSLSRYESQKRRDWNTFGQYLKNHRPPLSLSRCSGAHVLEFLRYLDQFGKTKVHTQMCPFYGHPNPPPHAPAHSARPGAPSTRSSAASAPPSKRTGASPRTTPSGPVLSGSTSAKSARCRPRPAASATRRRSAKSLQPSTQLSPPQRTAAPPTAAAPRPKETLLLLLQMLELRVSQLAGAILIIARLAAARQQQQQQQWAEEEGKGRKGRLLGI